MKTGFAAFLGALIGTQGRRLQGFAGTLLFFIAVGIGMIPVYVRWIIGACLLFLTIWWLFNKSHRWFNKKSSHGRRARGVANNGAPELGAVYVFRDAEGTIRYDGSSGDLDDMLARLKAHVEGSTAIAGLIRPGWTLDVEWVGSRDYAYAVEGERIDERIGTKGYENRRREGRGRRVA